MTLTPEQQQAYDWLLDQAGCAEVELCNHWFDRQIWQELVDAQWVERTTLTGEHAIDYLNALGPPEREAEPMPAIAHAEPDYNDSPF